MARKRAKAKAWGRYELQRLRMLYPITSGAKLGQLFKRTPKACNSKAKVMKLRKENGPKPWSKAEKKLLRKLYPDMRAHDVAARLGRDLISVYGQVKKLGLSKSAAFKASAASGRLTGKDGRGDEFRYKKGQKQPNGFKKNDPRLRFSIKTRFKKGQQPHTWVPIGTVRIRSGYLARKIKDGRKPGWSRLNWQFLHLLLWEKHRGKIPAGHVVTFKDGNRSNIKMKNLELIPRSELQARNSIARFPKELRELIRLERKLNRAIEESQREK